MAEKEFQLSDLQDALSKEKNSRQIIRIPDGFYRRLRNYLDELKEELEEIGFPSNTREELVQREYRRAKNYAEDLFRRRTQKVALAAVHHVGGSKGVDTDKMTHREEELFQDMTDLLDEMKEEVFFGGYKRKPKEKVSAEPKVEPKKEPVVKLEEEESTETKEQEKPKPIKKKEEPPKVEKEPVEEPPEEEVEEEKTVEKQGKQPVETELEETTEPKKLDEQLAEVLIHVIEDVPPFVDMDATYDLKKEDVVTLREDIANVLIQRGKAKKIELD